MSFRVLSEQLSNLRAPRFVEPVAYAEDPPAVLALEDISAASRSSAKLLITASTQQTVEALARRIHETGPRAQFPFVMTSAGELPIGAPAIRADCVSLLDAAAGGTVLIHGVEEMPASVQEVFIDVLAGLESARPPSTAVRLMSGTTVSLLDRIAAGTFSEQLFYRLNVIHLMVPDGARSTSPMLTTLRPGTSPGH